MIVETKEMFGHKQTQFGTIQRPLNQSFVWVRIDDNGELAKSDKEGRWKHAGYYMHARSVVVGLVDFPLELGEALAEALTKKLGKKVHWGDAPQTVEVESVDDCEEDLIDGVDLEDE